MFDKVQQLRNDENGVSPVIGVILMVAVTVVLAAVIGAFVFGMGDSLSDPAPNAQFEFDYNANTGDLSIAHDGGDTLNADNTGTLTVDASAGDSLTYVHTNIGTDGTVSGPVTAGDEIATLANVTAGATVDVVWETPDGGSSQVLTSYDA